MGLPRKLTSSQYYFNPMYVEIYTWKFGMDLCECHQSYILCEVDFRFREELTFPYFRTFLATPHTEIRQRSKEVQENFQATTAAKYFRQIMHIHAKLFDLTYSV